MKILAIPAANSRNGLNRQIIDHAARLLEDGLVADAEVEILDLNDDEMPIFSVERHEELGVPGPARRFFDKIGEVDAVIVSFAEHNGSYTVAWKNAYDWAERRRLWHRLTRPAGAPSPLHPPPGCAFHPRCAFAMEICTRIAPEPTPTPTGEVRCHLHTSGPELAGGDVRELVADSVADADPRPHQSATDPRSSR